MNFIRGVCLKLNAASYLAPAIGAQKINVNLISKCNFSMLIKKTWPEQKLLQLVPVSVTPSCGLKVKGKIRLRCRDCYFVRREGRLYVMCKTFPRHKQTHPVPKEKNTWILSHACQSKFRPY